MIKKVFLVQMYSGRSAILRAALFPVTQQVRWKHVGKMHEKETCARNQLCRKYLDYYHV